MHVDLAGFSVGYEHRSLKNPLGSLENLPARRALVLEMLEKNFPRFSLGSVCARARWARNARNVLGMEHKKSNYSCTVA